MLLRYYGGCMRKYKHNFRLEIFHPYSEPYDPLNDDVVVHVYLNDKVYHGWFFTPLRIQAIMETGKISGECINGTYFWSTDFLIIAEISQHNCEKVVDDLLEREFFYEVFSDITEGILE